MRRRTAAPQGPALQPARAHGQARWAGAPLPSARALLQLAQRRMQPSARQPSQGTPGSRTAANMPPAMQAGSQRLMQQYCRRRERRRQARQQHVLRQRRPGGGPGALHARAADARGGAHTSAAAEQARELTQGQHAAAAAAASGTHCEQRQHERHRTHLQQNPHRHEPQVQVQVQVRRRSQQQPPPCSRPLR